MTKEGYPWSTYLQDYLLLLEGRRFWFVVYTLLKSLSNLIPFAVVYLLGKIVDFFTTFHSGDSLTKLYIFIGTIAVLGVFQVWLRFFAKVRMQNLGAEIRKEVRVAAMSKLMDLELRWHDKENTGSKIHKINSGGESVYSGIKDFSNEGTSIITELIGAMIIFVVLDWRYALFGLLFVIIHLSAEYYFNRKLSYWEDQLSRMKEKVSGKINESASNLLTIKSLGLKESFQKKTSSYEEMYYQAWAKRRNASETKVKTIKSFAALGYAGFILLISYDVMGGLITVGSIIVYATYFGKLRVALDEVTNKGSMFIETKSSIGRFMTIYRADFKEDKSLIDVPANWKEIEFRNVTFRYKNEKVLDNFNLKIKRGEKIGMVGKSGCGKSTLVKLLLRLYLPNSGEILIDGMNLNRFKHKSLTDNFGVVLQESEVFNLSLLDNVTISSPRSNSDAFKRAVDISQLGMVLEKLPQGWNTLLGEKGYHLSGGERQRVGIARAVYKDSPMLILDEATSALDSKTESQIQVKLEKHLKPKTLLIIAHRLSTLRNVDKINVMEKGKIIESGTFEELIAVRKKFLNSQKIRNEVF